MKYLKKISLLLTACVFLNSFSVYGAIPHAYWQYHTEFANAKESKNDQRIIDVSVNIVNLMSAQPIDSDSAGILFNAHQSLAESYKNLKMYEESIESLKQRNIYAEHLGFTDSVIGANLEILKLDPLTEVYIESKNLDNAIYYGAKFEPKSGVYYGRPRSYNDTVKPVTEGNETIFTIYVNAFEEKLLPYVSRETTLQSGLNGEGVQFAYNMPHGNENAHLQKFLDLQPSSSEYQDLVESFKVLSTYKGPVFFRFAGEMNVWTSKADPETFKQAYIKMYKIVSEYAPNVAMIFSPNCVSSWGTNVNDYYPGDEYVSWVGISNYINKYSNPNDKTYVDEIDEIFTNKNRYANLYTSITEIVELYGDRKPILISETAIGNNANYINEDLTNFAKFHMEQFYSYLGIVYPQIKGVIYFDVTRSESYNYSISPNEELHSFYSQITNKNNMIMKSNESVSSTYVKADGFYEIPDTLTFASFCAPINDPTVTVTYYLNGIEMHKTVDMPYKFSIPASDITPEAHTLEVVFEASNNYKKHNTYSLVKNNEGVVTINAK